VRGGLMDQNIPSVSIPVESVPGQFKQWIYSDGSLSLEAYKAQASGHSSIFSLDNDTKIAKPLNPHEGRIYEELQKVPQLIPHVPQYFGRMNTPTTSNSHQDTQVRSFQTKNQYIVLENLTHGHVHPCVMDIKLGRKNYAEDGTHSPGTIRKRKVLCTATTAAEFGFRISGMRIYRPLFGNYLIRKTIHSTRMLSPLDGSLMEAIKLFLHDGGVVQVNLIMPFIEKLFALAAALKSQQNFDFMASSVLLIYDGAPRIRPEEAKCDVYLIDFDHTIILADEGRKPSETGVIDGIESLAGLFRKLLLVSTVSHSNFDLGTRDAHDDVEKKRPRSQSNPMLICPRGSTPKAFF